MNDDLDSDSAFIFTAYSISFNWNVFPAYVTFSVFLDTLGQLKEKSAHDLKSMRDAY